MKKRQLLFGVMLVISTLIGLTVPVNTLGDGSWGVRVYDCVRVNADNRTRLQIAGVDLARYGYVEVYHYALVDDEALFVLGAKLSRPEEPNSLKVRELSIISFSDQKETIIAQPRDIAAQFVMRATWKVFFFTNLRPSPPFVLLEYFAGEFVQKLLLVESETYLEVYRLDSGQATLLQQEQLTELKTLYELPPGGESQYRSPANLSPDTPAQTDLMRYFFTDANNDGYADILIWKRRYVSLTNEDTRKGDFYLEKEELHVMYFELEGMTFSSMVPLDNVRVKYLDDIIW